MRGNRGADIRTRAVDNVHHTCGKTGFARYFAKHERRHGRELTRFRDARITARDGGRDFPAKEIERQVPRRGLDIFQKSRSRGLDQFAVDKIENAFHGSAQLITPLRSPVKSLSLRSRWHSSRRALPSLHRMRAASRPAQIRPASAATLQL